MHGFWMEHLLFDLLGWYLCLRIKTLKNAKTLLWLVNTNYICSMKNLISIISTLSNLIGDTEEKAKEQFNLMDLSIKQMHYLETVNLLDNPNITELAIRLKLSKPTVKVAVDKLIERDYVYKVQSDEDRRSAHLHLTEKGKLINQMHDFAHKSIAEQFVRKLNAEEVKNLENLLTKVLY